ncbi:hypothetical protein BOTBODRAFT_25678 [Botryobasidium botryosum FD-172 SS1]|uniref:Heat shock protein 70 n=1 Tax=Botryobasidium botryosum (strain FD-172 SS1) TaxID=930990 RepID=A0A067MZT5_BOTB1|nr:hypothetical protein BOTBODRAFT_25678 [Botryobasidium botryosum FD-172 SS1]
MASVVGIDFGNLSSKIGVARARGIDIIVNEVSNRATPSLISFGQKQRAIGESAKTLETSNFRNTIGSLKRLVGRQLSDPEISEIEKKFINATLLDVNGSVGVQVNFKGEQRQFSAVQLVAMYLGKLKDTAAKELKQNVSDVVISVPSWFTEVQRRAVLDSAAVAGLNPLRLINDTTAIALGYGITKSDLPEPENPRHVVFVDIGHSNYTVAVVAFSKGQLTVKSTASDRHFGGRDLDYALLTHFAEEFKGKYKIDVLSSPKAIFRLSTQCERLKKVLSANAESTITIESIMNDIDASSKLSRDAFEGLIAPLLERVAAPLREALSEAGLTPEQIDTVELVGGTTRVPAIKARIGAVFPGKPLMTTLNADEAVARGATFACAMLSPVFRVREFAFHDVTSYPIQLQWERAAEDSPDEDTQLVVFPRNNTLPSTKLLTFARSAPFEIEAQYANPSALPGKINPWIGKLSAKNVTSDADGNPSTIKVKTRLNSNGVLSFEAVYAVEELPIEEEPSMDIDAPAPAEGEAPLPKKKKAVKKDIQFVAGYTGLDTSILNSLREVEAEMFSADKLVMDTEERKNALEEYVYDMRSKLEDRYAAYAQPAEKQTLLAALQQAEDWLYSEEGEDALKSAYVERIEAVHKLGDPISNRYKEAEERPRASSQLRETINGFLAYAQSEDEKYAHIEASEKQSVIERCATAAKWLDDQLARQAERPKNVDPALTSVEILSKRDDIYYFATPIFNKPKPKPKTETPPPPPPPSGTETPKGETGEAPKEPTNMDVD